jgi:[ribosomal protein S5]-alanine N-acetyltransferase
VSERVHEILSISDADIRLSSARTTLRPMERSDAPSIQGYANDLRVLEHLALEPETLAQTEVYIADALADNERQPRVRYRLSVVSREDGVLIGDCVLRIDVPVRDRQGEIGIVLRPDRWDLGFGTDVAKLLAEFAFRRIGVHRIYAHVRPQNAASIRVLEKVGMRLEGRFREHRRIRGTWQDSLIYGLLEDDLP